MGLNYIKEDEKVNEKIILYRKSSKIVEEDDRCKQLQVQENKNPENAYMFQDYEYNNREWQKEHILFDKKEYIFCSFKNTKFGRKAVLDEDKMYCTNSSFWDVTFENCTFENIYFDACYFWNCTFKNCRFSEYKTIFNNCCLKQLSMIQEESGFATKYGSTEFINCDMTSVEWRSCLGDRMIFEGNTFMDVSFRQCEMPDVIMKDNRFYSTYFNNCDIRNLCIIGIRNADLEFHFTDKSKDINMHKKIYIGKIDEQFMKEKDEFEAASKMYYTLLDYLGMKNIDTEYMSEYRYCYNYFSMRGKQWWQQVWDRFSWLVCGYGEKLGRFVVTFLLTIIIPAIGYLFCGIKVGDKTIRYPLIDGTEFSLINFVKDFGKCLHFSIVTFSTVGYGNIVPSGISYIISAIQILIGVLFVALFTSIMLKKILR